MAGEQEIRSAIEDFGRSESSSRSTEQLFGAWILHTQHRLSASDALAQSADGSSHGVIDGFAVNSGPRTVRPELVVIQTKLSPDESSALEGLQELARAVEVVSRLLARPEAPAEEEGELIRRLRSMLCALDPSQRERLSIRCCLYHLVARDSELWQQRPRVRKAINDFQVALASSMITAELFLFGPSQIRLPTGIEITRPSQPRELRFSGTCWRGSEGESVYIGLGWLADLVALHDHYREALFGKNVRMYLFHEASKPRSAARHILRVLEQICDGNEPLHFAMAHNGVTVTAPRVTEVSADKILVEPLNQGLYVLNGCQTVYTAWKFFKDREGKERRDRNTRWRAAWSAIRIPVRIVVTTDDDRVRRVTVAANRQTEMRPSAFWAQDGVQLALGDRLATMKVFYERQEDAWEHLRRSAPNRAAEYINGVLNIEDLARVIAAVAPDVSLDNARSPAGIFDSEETYRRVFAPDNLRSVRMLVALRNLQNATRLALKDLTESVKNLADLPHNSFQYPVLRLLTAWLTQNDPAWVVEQGERLMRGASLQSLRDDAKRLMSASNSGIQQLVRNHWRDGESWLDAYHAQSLRQASKDLGVVGHDPFAAVEDD